MTRYLVLILLALWVYALVDLARTPQQQVRLMPKWLWVLVIMFTWIVGATIWLLFGRSRIEYPPQGRGDGSGGGGGGTWRGGGPRPTAPVAPDDDPAFLRRLDEQTWRAKMEQLRRERTTGSGDPESPADPQAKA